MLVAVPWWILAGCVPSVEPERQVPELELRVFRPGGWSRVPLFRVARTVSRRRRVHRLAAGPPQPPFGVSCQANCQEEASMSDEDVSVVRAAYEAYGQGEVNRLLELVDPDLEWTYLDPSMAEPQPQTCHGREQLAGF